MWGDSNMHDKETARIWGVFIATVHDFASESDVV